MGVVGDNVITFDILDVGSLFLYICVVGVRLEGSLVNASTITVVLCDSKAVSLMLVLLLWYCLIRRRSR